MLKLKTISLSAASITIFLFLFFSSFTKAQSDNSYNNIYTPQSDYSNIIIPQSEYFNIYTPQMDYSNIYTPYADQSNIYTLNQDLIDFHHPSLYQSIHSNENNSGSLLIILDEKGNVISVINLNNDENNKQKNS